MRANKPGELEVSGPIRVAVIGCGAMSREFHLPVLAGYEGVQLSVLVDRDAARAEELARAYGIGTVLNDAADLTRDLADAALIATPPFHHAPCAIELASRGLHLLVEKPMALTAIDARAMVEAADRAGVVLAVGLFRRLYPSMRLLRSLVADGPLGRPVGFDYDTGGVYGWPLTTLANMRKDQGGGGVLIDIAPHVFDQILYALPGNLELIEYRDNARGGIESDCELRLRVRGPKGDAIDGRIELSRTRKLRNTLRIDCERGAYELRSGERFRVEVKPNGCELSDALTGRARPFRLNAEWTDEPESPGFEAYRVQIDDWVGAIRGGQKLELSGASAVPVVAFIEECYGSRQPLAEPWVEEGLGGLGPLATSNGHAGAVPATVRMNGSRRVLVTGATGFIGCRTAEILSLRDGWQVRGLVRNPANASRLARLPVEMILGDLNNDADMARAVQGCDAVVHCAIGTAYGNPREIFRVTVDGTRRLAEASRAAGVARFIHVSTAAVYGKNLSGSVDESSPLNPSTGDDYSQSKVQAEREIQSAIAAGLPAIILRPTNVFGPFGATLITRPIGRMARGELVLVGGAKKPGNFIYVDNVAQAIAAALEAPAAATGDAFTISDGDAMTWAEFYGYFANELGLDPPRDWDSAPAKPEQSRRGPLAWAGAWWRGCKDVLTSAEMKGLAKRYLNTDPVGRLPRRVIEIPGVERRVRRVFKMDAPLVYRPEEHVPAGPMVMDPLGCFFSPAKARRELRFISAVPANRALELTLEWITNSRLVERRRNRDARSEVATATLPQSVGSAAG